GGAVTMILRRLWHDRRGAGAVLLGLALPGLIGFAALGVETGLWYSIKWQNQNAADAAAWSAGIELSKGKNCADIGKLATYGASKNLPSSFPTSSLATGFNSNANNSGSCNSNTVGNCQTVSPYTMCVNN